MFFEDEEPLFPCGLGDPFEPEIMLDPIDFGPLPLLGDLPPFFG